MELPLSELYDEHSDSDSQLDPSSDSRCPQRELFLDADIGPNEGTELDIENRHDSSSDSVMKSAC
jgi:hypothetical protein